MPTETPLTILVIDDEPPILEMLQRIGQQAFPEASFVGVASPQQAFAYLNDELAQQPKLILLDIDFQQSVNGLDVLPQLRARLQGKAPIIMFSGHSTDTNIIQTYEKGAVAYTQKPQDLAGWRAYVERLKTYWHQTVVLPN
ncbi:response regulator [Spirosoma sp. BT702]|uniref:Response regulator n=1 Tax=Spirosoma profusum TaxID=2771354 RepID=A0A926XYQ3_9BACT|nr:response regulator [Spirosoma profusum]MBD2703314.1 response regulator [Spirosoma profusum]